MSARALPFPWTILLASSLAVIVTTGGVALDVQEAAAAAPYRVRHFELADLGPSELFWTAEPRLGFPPRRPRDKRGVPMILVGGQRYCRPGALAINGMKRIVAYEDLVDRRQLDQALLQARQLRRRCAWWMPFWYDHAPAAQRDPWVNAMSQGLALSFFVRLHRVTGDSVHLDAARKVFRSFLGLDRPGTMWVSYVDSDRDLWLEHYPRSQPAHVLNANVHAIFGIYEFWQLTRSRRARQVLEGAITTMRDHTRRYRRPRTISLYDLRNRSVILCA